MSHYIKKYINTEYLLKRVWYNLKIRIFEKIYSNNQKYIPHFSPFNPLSYIPPFKYQYFLAKAKNKQKIYTF